MRNRDWLEKLFISSIQKVLPDFEDSEENFKKLEQVIENTFQKIVEIFIKSLKSQSKKMLRWRRGEIKHFKKNLKKRWGKAFDKLELFIMYNLEYGEIVLESVRNKGKNDLKFETLLKLHARACQISYEILELLCGGFADGAFARWRSLYEISIISNFLVDKPIELCQRYLDYYFIESYYEMKEYQKNWEKLNQEPLTNEEIQEHENKISELIKQYGSDFLKPYGWLGSYLPKDKWNFAGIEETTDLKHFRSYYKFANNYVHSGAKGFIYKLGMLNQEKIMLAGPSNYGFADPAQYAALSLFHTTSTLSNFDDYLEDSLYLRIGVNLYDELCDTFVLVQNKIEEEENQKH
jgi:hypothetical protein